LGAVSYFYPSLVPAYLVGYLPWILPTSTSTSTLTPTDVPVVLPVETLASEPTFTLTLEPSPTVPPTRTFTPTNSPTDGPTQTPEITLTPSETPVGGGFGQVAFASQRTGVPQIYIINADGSDLHPITNLPQGACQPSWSPNGSRLVFTSPCQINTDSYSESSLYLINADGSNLAPLSSAPGGDFDPAWSPDGKRIAFTSLRDGHKEIYVMDTSDFKVTRLTSAVSADEENSQPAWSPFSNQLAFVRKRFGALQIWTMTDTGQNPEQVVRSGQTLWDYYPVWSPDAQYILFNQRQVNANALPWLMQIRFEDRETQLPSRLRLGVVGIVDISYSADGFWVVYEGLDDRSNTDVYYMTASGATRTRLTTDPKDDFDPAWRPLTNP
jgi:Tol biopolymer transport system component